MASYLIKRKTKRQRTIWRRRDSIKLFIYSFCTSKWYGIFNLHNFGATLTPSQLNRMCVQNHWTTYQLIQAKASELMTNFELKTKTAINYTKALRVSRSTHYLHYKIVDQRPFTANYLWSLNFSCWWRKLRPNIVYFVFGYLKYELHLRQPCMLSVSSITIIIII